MADIGVQSLKRLNSSPSKKRALPCKPKANQPSSGKGIKRKRYQGSFPAPAISFDNKKPKKISNSNILHLNDRVNKIGEEIHYPYDPNSNAPIVTPPMALINHSSQKDINPQDIENLDGLKMPQLSTSDSKGKALGYLNSISRQGIKVVDDKLEAAKALERYSQTAEKFKVLSMTKRFQDFISSDSDTLDLTAVGITSSYLLNRELLQCAEKNKKISTLYLVGNKISDEDLDYILRVLKRFDLNVLDLSCNDITNNGLKFIKDFLEANQSLTTLYLSDNKITDLWSILKYHTIQENITIFCSNNHAQKSIIWGMNMSFLNPVVDFFMPAELRNLPENSSVKQPKLLKDQLLTKIHDAKELKKEERISLLKAYRRKEAMSGDFSTFVFDIDQFLIENDQSSRRAFLELVDTFIPKEEAKSLRKKMIDEIFKRYNKVLDSNKDKIRLKMMSLGSKEFYDFYLNNNMYIINCIKAEFGFLNNSSNYSLRLEAAFLGRVAFVTQLKEIFKLDVSDNDLLNELTNKQLSSIFQFGCDGIKKCINRLVDEKLHTISKRLPNFTEIPERHKLKIISSGTDWMVESVKSDIERLDSQFTDYLVKYLKNNFSSLLKFYHAKKRELMLKELLITEIRILSKNKFLAVDLREYKLRDIIFTHKYWSNSIFPKSPVEDRSTWSYKEAQP